MDILYKLQDIFRDFFDDESIALTKETSLNDIEGWDSLAQIDIVIICEAEFGVKFDLSDITKFKKVGDIVALLEEKLGS